MRRHPSAGVEMLAGLEFPWDVRPMIESHHERWDGKGYPHGLQGEGIPFSARLLAVADVYDALTTERSYKPALTHEAALELMSSTPLVVRAVQVNGGEALLIDESYNANPASMAATLKSLGTEKDIVRRIAVLGPMRELGTHSAALHAGLAPAIRDSHVDRLILIGEEMLPLAQALYGQTDVTRAQSVEDATDRLMRLVRPGDAILVKASNSVGLAKLVERMVEGLPCST